MKIASFQNLHIEQGKLEHDRQPKAFTETVTLRGKIGGEAVDIVIESKTDGPRYVYPATSVTVNGAKLERAQWASLQQALDTAWHERQGDRKAAFASVMGATMISFAE